MDNAITGITRGGTVWMPSFVIDLNQRICIGCGRCYKACPRNVFELVDRDELDALPEDDGMDDNGDDVYGEDGFSDDTSMVMAIANALDCIGCEACSRVCPKKCLSHAPQALAMGAG
jgi:Nif-specific ferredoxin III